MKRLVRLHIERLVIDGAPGVRADRLNEAMVDELRRLASIAAPPTDTESELVVDMEHSPLAAGRAIAAQIHSHLNAEVDRG